MSEAGWDAFAPKQDTAAPDAPETSSGGAGDMLGGFGHLLSNLPGFVTGGLLPSENGQHEGPLADCMRVLFGRDPWAANAYQGALRGPTTASPVDPRFGQRPFSAAGGANAPVPDLSAPGSPEAGGMKVRRGGQYQSGAPGSVQYAPDPDATPASTPAPSDDGRADRPPPTPLPVPAARPGDDADKTPLPTGMTKTPGKGTPSPVGAPDVTAEALAGRQARIDSGNTPMDTPIPRTDDLATSKKTIIYAPRSELDAQKPLGSLSPKRQMAVQLRTFFRGSGGAADAGPATGNLGSLTIYDPPSGVTRSDTVGTPRDTGDIKGFVIHHTEGGSLGSNLENSNNVNTGANYYIDRTGKVVQWAGDNVAMNHIGGGRNTSTDTRPDLINHNTLSVEMVTGANGEGPTPAQQEAALHLVAAKSKQYNIPAGNVLGHHELVPEWKSPGEGDATAQMYRNAAATEPKTLGPPTTTAEAYQRANLPKVGDQTYTSSQPGNLLAVTDQNRRTYDPNGYGSPLTGKVVVNGHPYDFMSGGHGRGSSPFGQFTINRYTSQDTRVQEGRDFTRSDAYELGDRQDNAPGVQNDPVRTGLLIHPAANGTAGCLGINPAQWPAFKRDLDIEIARAGGRKVTIDMGPQRG